MTQQYTAGEGVESAPDEKLQIRVSGLAGGPTLIYLPGIHGDWTLVGPFRARIVRSVRFVEFTYPRTLGWSLRDYAAHVLEALRREGINQGWLLAESFGSQVAWAVGELLREGPQPPRFQMEGIILAGGFPEYPMKMAARWVATWKAWTGNSGISWAIRLYSRTLKWRLGGDAVGRQSAQEFLSRRTWPDAHAMLHRLHLLIDYKPSAGISKLTRPVYYLSGLIDPIVPWFLVKRQLPRVCGSFREAKVLLCGDHNVLGSAPAQSERQILKWIGVSPKSA